MGFLEFHIDIVSLSECSTGDVKIWGEFKATVDHSLGCKSLLGDLKRVYYGSYIASNREHTIRHGDTNTAI
jgi:hypothetical protein